MDRQKLGVELLVIAGKILLSIPMILIGLWAMYYLFPFIILFGMGMAIDDVEGDNYWYILGGVLGIVANVYWFVNSTPLFVLLGIW